MKKAAYAPTAVLYLEFELLNAPNPIATLPVSNTAEPNALIPIIVFCVAATPAFINELLPINKLFVPPIPLPIIISLNRESKLLVNEDAVTEPLNTVLVILELPKVTVLEPCPTALAPITISFCPLL